MPTVSTHAAVDVPSYVIMMDPERHCVPLRRKLEVLVPKMNCIRATRRTEIRIETNGSARLSTGARLLYRYPFVHLTTFAVHELELAILASHLRAMAAGYESGSLAFAIFEEDAEWSMLLSSPHDALRALLDAMPRQWHVLQAAIIAEIPYLRHLHGRLKSAEARASHPNRSGRGTTPAPIVLRDSLRGLSWPFTPGREVIANQTWVRPYWSAAAYAVSRQGASTLLRRFWPNWPRLGADVTIDMTSQLYPVADQILFNVSGAYVTQPLLTQPADGAHFEHAKYKRTARAFVFNNWRRSWMLLRGTALTTVPLHVYSVGADGGNDTGCIEALGAMSSGSSASMLEHNSERRAERSTRRHRSGGSSSPSALLLPGAGRLGLPAHVQVLDVTIDTATERALRSAAVGLRDDGTLQAGAPAYALVLPLPFLLLQSVPNVTSELLRSALLLIDRMKREETNSTAINAALQSPSTSSSTLGGEKKAKRSDPVPRVGGTPDVTLLTLRGSIGMTANPVPSLRRKARLQLSRQLSCLMGHGAHTEEAGDKTDTQSDAWLQALRGAERPAAIGHAEGLSEHPRKGSEIKPEITPCPCPYAQRAAGLLVRVERIPALLKALRLQETPSRTAGQIRPSTIQMARCMPHVFGQRLLALAHDNDQVASSLHIARHIVALGRVMIARDRSSVESAMPPTASERVGACGVPWV
jgi:hypothetical protein